MSFLVVMKSNKSPCSPTGMNHSFVKDTHTRPISSHLPVKLLSSFHLDFQINHCAFEVVVLKEPLVDLMMAPKHRSSDAANLDTPQRNCEVLPLSIKVGTVI